MTLRGRSRITRLGLLMYIGPETMMPLASALAAVAGFLLMFWRRFVGFVRMTVQAASRTLSRIFASR